MSTCFCTLAIHASYRARARLLCADLAPAHVVVVTDEPADFADLPVHAIRHEPTGPMAADYSERLATTGHGRGAAAYHDKRFAVQAALRDFDTAIFLDADSRIRGIPPLVHFQAGLAVIPIVQHSIAIHLETCGSWRLPAFKDLADELLGDTKTLFDAKWCHETCFAVTKNGSEDRFLWAWGHVAAVLQRQEIFSGEGGVIGLAAMYAGWTVDFEILAPLAALIEHEGGGPK